MSKESCKKQVIPDEKSLALIPDRGMRTYRFYLQGWLLQALPATVVGDTRCYTQRSWKVRQINFSKRQGVCGVGCLMVLWVSGKDKHCALGK